MKKRRMRLLTDKMSNMGRLKSAIVAYDPLNQKISDSNAKRVALLASSHKNGLNNHAKPFISGHKK
jgi:hypothetical protein